MKKITTLIECLFFYVFVHTSQASPDLDIGMQITPITPMFKLTQFTDDIQNPISQQTDEQNLMRINQQIINYNKFYKTNIKTADELESDMINRLKSFSDKLRQCTPGTYQYSVAGPFDLLYITTIIKGQEEGLCVTDTSYTMGVWGTVNTKCRFQPSNLQEVADRNPDLAMVMVLSDRTAFIDKNQPMDDCKTTTSGSL